MPELERYDAVVIGSGEGGKYLAWHMAQTSQRTAVVERRWIGGSCPNINSARVNFGAPASPKYS